jgi:threonine dehydrogenase-like Zn-dependent dehydrogenase
MDCVLPTKTTILLKLQFVRSVSLVLGRGVIALLALSAAKGHDIAHRLILSVLPRREERPFYVKNSGNDEITQ